MKSVSIVSLLVFGALASVNGARTGDTISKVVDMLKGMLDKSKAGGDADREVYAKFKCYCDTNEKEKTESVETLTTQIELLGNDIEGTQGSTGKLSTQVAKLAEEMSENEQAREMAESMREKENKAFIAEEADLTAAIGQMKEAIKALAEIGGDQDLQSSAEHDKFMAGYNSKKNSLLKIRASVNQALIAAKTLVEPAQRQKVESLVQAPFTGTYTAQSGEVVGILKNMRDTFKSNLESAQLTEKKAKEANEKFMATKQEEFDSMKKSFDKKQDKLGTNDEDLAAKKQQHTEAVQQKSDDEAFLAKLLPMCDTKAKEYAERKLLRSNEDAALAKAVVILNSETSSDTFSTVAGANGFVQVRSSSSGAVRVSAQRALQQTSRRSARLAKIAALLASGNPFKKVLKEIEKMKQLIVKDGEADQAQLDWCNSERDTNNKNLDDKKTQIDELKTAITGLDDSINNPDTGFKKQIADADDSLKANTQSMEDETASRRAENTVYQEAMANAAQGKLLVQQATAVLENYYSSLSDDDREGDSSLLQEDPAPPDTWDDGKQGGGGAYEGQSEKGNTVVELLKSIEESITEQMNAQHKDEAEAQASYEDSMAELKKTESELQESIAELRVSVLEAEKSLVDKRAELDQTHDEKVSIERYLKEIKAGCDFITDNFDARVANRKEETAALDNAKKLLKGTPSYSTAMAAQEEKELGKCKDTCLENKNHVDCKACRAGVSVPGYCAGHADAEGC